MKIAGIDPKSLCNEVLLVLPRGDSQIVFRAIGLRDLEEFNKVCPQPQPPGKRTREGFIPNMNDPTYQQVMTEWGKKRFGYMLVKSLEPSEIEWDTVNLADPRTWLQWEDELRDSGLTQIEVNRVATLVLEANALDDEKLTKAREYFLLGRENNLPESSGPATGQVSTQSGVLVKG